MHVAFNLAAELDGALKSVAVRAGLIDDHPGAFAPEVRTADPRHGDFQANGILGYAKARKLNPRAVAEKLVAALTPNVLDAYEVAIAGPGFINFTLKPDALWCWLAEYRTEERLRLAAASAHQGQTWVVDYSSPNTAKQMHVGHLRSAVIGEALCRLLEFTGAKVIRDNHIGDWGTGFGMLIWAYRNHLDAESFARDPLEEFERLYKLGSAAAKADATVLEAARAELVKLQSGDPANLAVWQTIGDVSLAAFQKIYDQLGIRFDVQLGESFYNDKLERIYRELTDCGLAEESEGALVVFHDEVPRYSRHAERPNPFMIRKADGAANYATTDLATILYRVEHFHATGALYVVDKRQSDHFEQLFLTAKKWFEKSGRTLPHLEHVEFGTVLGENNKPLKTKSGENIKLKELLGEAEQRAYAVVSAKNAASENDRLSDAECRAIGEVVGIASVQYADLSQNRSTDYVFAWDKMIALEGNTAGYMLYAVARVYSIFRKIGLTPGDGEAGASLLETAAERNLARKLVKFPDAIRLATDQLRPHFLCLYLYELAGEFSAFYTADKVAVEDPAIRARRLLLCSRTLLILETGLHLLGLRTLQRM